MTFCDLKSRDMTLPTKIAIVKAMAFPVVIYGCESWTIKKAGHQGIDALELWCWRRLLRVPWTARRSNQSILKEINPEYSLEGLMLKQKLRYFGHLMRRAYLLEKTLMLGKIVGRRRRVWQRMRHNGLTQWTLFWANSRRQWKTGKPEVHRVSKSRTLWPNNKNNLLTHLWQVSFYSLKSVFKATTLLPSTHSFLSTWNSRVPFGWSYLPWASLVAQLAKKLPVMQETWVWSLGWEDPLEEGKATHSCILAWRIPKTV